MPIYNEQRANTVSQIWNSLGTFWSEFENKDLIEAYWSGLLGAARLVQKDLYYITLSRTISTLPEILTSNHDFYTIYLSGQEKNIDVISGYSYYSFPPYTYFISGVYLVTYSGTINQDVYSEQIVEIDYEFGSSTGHRFKIPYVSGTGPFTYYINNSKRINPALFDVYGNMIGLTYDSWKNNYYHPFALQQGTTLNSLSSSPTNISGQTYIDLRLEHYKYLIWALSYYQRADYTLGNIKNAIGISAGLPFTWLSGVISEVTDDYITVNHGTNFIRYYRTIIPSGYQAENFKTYVVGSGVSQFEVLTSGVEVYDYYNYSGLISGLYSSNLERTSFYAIVMNAGIL